MVTLIVALLVIVGSVLVFGSLFIEDDPWESEWRYKDDEEGR